MQLTVSAAGFVLACVAAGSIPCLEAWRCFIDLYFAILNIAVSEQVVNAERGPTCALPPPDSRRCSCSHKLGRKLQRSVATLTDKTNELHPQNIRHRRTFDGQLAGDLNLIQNALIAGNSCNRARLVLSPNHKF